MYDTLSEAGITAHIKTKDVFRVEVRKSVTSTNSILREMAADGAPEGAVLAAEEQTAGKGRSGRPFYSPGGHGVYFSLLLRPRIEAAEAALITPAAAVATARAIEGVTGVYTGIKWVNDLFLDGKKVCGILTEATFDMANGSVDSAVLGIGINLTVPEDGYPQELTGAATALASKSGGGGVEHGRIIAAVLDDFWGFYRNLTARAFLREYRERSIILGRDIYVLSPGGKRPARAIWIDDDCRLVVRYMDNLVGDAAGGEAGGAAGDAAGGSVGDEIAALASGEVSIRTED